MKKKFSFLFLALFLTSSIFVASVYSKNDKTKPADSEIEKKNTAQESQAEKNRVEKIEVIYFHGTHDCYACRTVGKYAKQTVENCFAKELKEGKIIFKSINAYLPENKEIVFKYGAMGSSLWIGVYNKKGLHKEDVVNVWYKINNQMAFMSYLKLLIDKRLKGDFS